MNKQDHAKHVAEITEQQRIWRETHAEQIAEYERPYKEARAKRAKHRKPMSENKSCTKYLGCHVAERVLSRVFKNVDVMPPNHPGYDFICGRGYKIDVKSSCLSGGRWYFNTNRNTTADYFLCLAFDNREDLTPMHIWLLPGNLVNHLFNASISPNTIDKWVDYELDIDQTVVQCNLLRR